MDTDSVQILNKSLESPLNLSHADKVWVESINQAVRDTWDSEDPTKSLGLVFHGSEDYIRVQFEDYIMHLLASVKYDNFLTRPSPHPGLARDITGNPITLYNNAWVKEWKLTNNYRIFNKFTDGELFDIIEPKHLGEPTTAREGIAKSVSKVFGNLWATASTTIPTSSSSSSPTPKNADSQSIAGDVSDDNKSIAESVETTSHKSQKSMSTVSSANEQQPVQEGYFSGLTRWAARRRQKNVASPTQSRSPSITAAEEQNDDTSVITNSEALNDNKKENEN